MFAFLFQPVAEDAVDGRSKAGSISPGFKPVSPADKPTPPAVKPTPPPAQPIPPPVKPSVPSPKVPSIKTGYLFKLGPQVSIIQLKSEYYFPFLHTFQICMKFPWFIFQKAVAVHKFFPMGLFAY